MKDEKKDVNQHGLSRYIPREVRLTVRKNAGFGCVICGLAIIHYEHIDPEWHDAKEHDAEKMTALCAYDHDRVTRGFLSKETVKACAANPKAKADKYSKTELDLKTRNLTIIIAGDTYVNVTTPIGLSGEPLFVVKPPIDTSFEYLLSATFFDNAGKQTLKIEDNRCYFSADNWDVDMVGGRFTIRDNEKNICLCLITEPPHKVIIDEINMKINGWTLRGNYQEMTVTDPSGNATVVAGGNTYIGPTRPGTFHTHFRSQDDWGRKQMEKDRKDKMFNRKGCNS